MRSHGDFQGSRHHRGTKAVTKGVTGETSGGDAAARCYRSMTAGSTEVERRYRRLLLLVRTTHLAAVECRHMCCIRGWGFIQWGHLSRKRHVPKCVVTLRKVTPVVGQL